jgi:DNA gyrase subunit A
MLLITEQGMIIRVNVSDFRAVGRSTQGVRIIHLDENDIVVGAVKIHDRDNGDDELPPGEEPNGEEPNGDADATDAPEEPIH